MKINKNRFRKVFRIPYSRPLLTLLAALPLAHAQESADPPPAADRKAVEGNWLQAQVRMFRGYPHLHMAYQLIEQNNLPGAEAALRSFLEIEPGDTQARTTYISVLYRERKIDEVAKQADLLLAQDPTNAIGQMYRSLSLQQAGRWEEAMTSFMTVYRNPRATKEGRIFAASSAADIALEHKRYPEALAALDALQAQQATFEVIYRRGLVLDALGKLDDARQAFDRALSVASLAGQRREALSALGYAAIKQGHTGEALELGRAVLKLSPGDLEWRRMLANLEYDRKAYAEAEDHARQALKLSHAPSDRMMLGNILSAAGKHTAATDQYRQALTDASDPELRYQAAMALGYALDATGDREGARHAFATAVDVRSTPDATAALAVERDTGTDSATSTPAAPTALQPPSPAVVQPPAVVQSPAPPDPSTVGQQLAARGQLKKAIAVLEQALMQSDDDRLRLQLAELYARAGESGKVAHLLRQTRLITADDHRRAGALYAQIGYRDEAERHLKHGATNGEARLQLSQFYLDIRQPEKALAVLDDLLAQKTSKGIRIRAWRQAGYIHAQLGHQDAALSAFNEAAESGDRTMATRAEIGYLLSTLGRHAQALDAFQTVLAHEPSSQAALNVARTYVALNQADDALKYYELARKNIGQLDVTEQAALLSELGHLFAARKDYAQAYRYWREAEARHNDIATQLNLAYAEEQLSKPDEALGRLDALSAQRLSREERILLLEQYARLFEGRGERAKAEKMLEQAETLDPSPERQYQMGLMAMKRSDNTAAIRHLSAAVKAQPDNAEYALQLAYLCKTNKDFDCAARNFETVVRLQPQRADIYEELGYTYSEAGETERAVEWFKRAIDHRLEQKEGRRRVPPAALTSYLLPASGDQTPQSSADDDERVYRLRQQVRDMSRRYQFNAYQSYRPKRGRGTSDITPGFQTGGLIPSQGGIEFVYQPPKIGYRDGRTFRVFARTLWSNEEGSLSIDSRTYQGGIGAEYKPLRDQNIYLSLERMIKIGSQSQDNWLARVSWGYSDGYDMQPGKASWNQTIIYADIGYQFQRDKTKAVYVEARQGHSFNYNDRWMVTPHVTAVGRGQRPDPFDASYLEFGAGVSVKYLFNETRYEAARSSTEWIVQYRVSADHNRASTWVFAAALQY